MPRQDLVRPRKLVLGRETLRRMESERALPAGALRASQGGTCNTDCGELTWLVPCQTL